MAQLSREKFFALNEASRKRIYAGRRAAAMISHAKWSAQKYARLLLADGIVDENLAYHGRYAWTPKTRLELAGGEIGIKNTLMTQYQVKEPLLAYATRIVLGLLQEGR